MRRVWKLWNKVLSDKSLQTFGIKFLPKMITEDLWNFITKSELTYTDIRFIKSLDSEILDSICILEAIKLTCRQILGIKENKICEEIDYNNLSMLVKVLNLNNVTSK